MGFFILSIMIGIYKITSPSGKVYIGQSIDIEQRIAHYRTLDCKNQRKLYNSLKKHGVENHLFEVVCECEEQDLNSKESFYINFYNSTIHGLNIMSVDPETFKYRHSEESKRKMSLSRTGKKQSEERRLKCAFRIEENRYRRFGSDNHFYGKKHSKETIEIIRQKSKNRQLTPEQKQKHLEKAIENGKKRLGMKFNKEWRENISDAKKGKCYGGDNNNAKKCICTITKKIYPSLKDAYNASDKKYSYRYFTQMLNNTYTNKTKFELRYNEKLFKKNYEGIINPNCN